jgi:hypothetical protein
LCPGVDVVGDQGVAGAAAAAGALAVSAGLEVLDPSFVCFEGAFGVAGLEYPVAEAEDVAGDGGVAPPLLRQAQRKADAGGAGGRLGAGFAVEGGEVDGGADVRGGFVAQAELAAVEQRAQGQSQGVVQPAAAGARPVPGSAGGVGAVGERIAELPAGLAQPLPGGGVGRVFRVGGLGGGQGGVLCRSSPVSRSSSPRSSQPEPSALGCRLSLASSAARAARLSSSLGSSASTSWPSAPGS